MPRDRAAERQKAKDAVFTALLPLLDEDRTIVLDDVRHFLANRPEKLRRAVSPTPSADPQPKAAKKPVGNRLMRTISVAKAVAAPVQSLANKKSERSRLALLAIASRSPAPYDWLCAQVYGED